MGLAVNALEPCGTRSAKVRHAAHGALCAVCSPEDAPFVEAAQLRRERASQGLSQRELAVRAGVSQGLVSSVETHGGLRLAPRGGAA